MTISGSIKNKLLKIPAKLLVAIVILVFLLPFIAMEFNLAFDVDLFRLIPDYLLVDWPHWLERLVFSAFLVGWFLYWPFQIISELVGVNGMRVLPIVYLIALPLYAYILATVTLRLVKWAYRTISKLVGNI